MRIIERIEKDLDIDNQRFADLLLLVFLVSAIGGWIYEMLFYRIDVGKFIDRGQGIGPWLPIYGFGGVAIFLLAYKFRENKLKVFAISGMLSGIVEYMTGWFLYTFLDGMRLWDYNSEIWNFGNINGFICLRSILVFAFAGMFVIYGLVPMLKKAVIMADRQMLNIFSFGMFIIFVFDILFGYFL